MYAGQIENAAGETIFYRAAPSYDGAWPILYRAEVGRGAPDGWPQINWHSVGAIKSNEPDALATAQAFAKVAAQR
jgi:hypothetical protein